MNQLNRLPDKLAGSVVIGKAQPATLCFLQCAPNYFHAESLRSLHRPEFGTVQSARNEPAILAFLYCISQRMRRSGRAGPSRRLKRGQDQFLSYTRTRSIVNRNQLNSGIKPLQTIPDRVLPLWPARSKSEGFPETQLRGKPLKMRLHALAHHKDNGVYLRARFKCAPTMGYHRLAGNGQKNLVHPRPHSGAPSSGYNDGGIAHLVAPWFNACAPPESRSKN